MAALMSEVDKAMFGTEESHVGVIVRAAMADTCYALGCRVHPSRWDWSHLVEDLDMDWVSEGVLAYMHDLGWEWHADELHDLEEADPWHECHWVGFGGGIPLWQKGVTCGSDVEGLGLKYQKGLALLGIVVAEDFCSFGQAGLVGWKEFREHWGAHEGDKGAWEEVCEALEEGGVSTLVGNVGAPTGGNAEAGEDGWQEQEPVGVVAVKQGGRDTEFLVQWDEEGTEMTWEPKEHLGGWREGMQRLKADPAAWRGQAWLDVAKAINIQRRSGRK